MKNFNHGFYSVMVAARWAVFSSDNSYLLFSGFPGIAPSSYFNFARKDIHEGPNFFLTQ